MTALDLSPFLRDGYLRKAIHGPEKDPLELLFHVLRVVVTGRRTGPRDRLYGLRFEGVAGVGIEAVRWHRDAATFVPVRSDWLSALTREEMEPVIVGTAALGDPEAIGRLAQAGDRALWLTGGPDEAAAALALGAQSFEATAEGILPDGTNVNARVLVVANRVRANNPQGVEVPIESLPALGEQWTQNWRDYWRRKDGPRAPAPDAQYEWSVPVADDL